MPDQEQIEQQQELLATCRRRLAYNIKQRAQLGVIAPFSLSEDIRSAYDEIRRRKATLRGWGLLVDDLPDDEPPPAAPVAVSEQAGAGLIALADLLDAPNVREAVEGFKESFEIVCRQIDRLSSYKDLHDLLHDLQFNCYNPIVRGSRDFPNNLLFLESMADYQAELQEIFNNLGEIADRAALQASEQAWIRQIGQAAELLQSAMEQANKELLERAAFQIGRVLYVHPSRINERLKEAARDLPLSNLIKAMVVVQQHPARADLAADKLAQVGQGIAALDQLSQGLTLLIDEHDTWQELNLELHRVEENLERHAQELEWLWPDLLARIEPLCQGRDDRWTRDLRQAGERLSRELLTHNLATIVAAFHPVRRQVGLCFFQADKKLKELCRTLRQVDGPLTSVISIIA